MRSHLRTIVVLALAVGLIAWFLHNVDLRRVAADIIRARPEWLILSLATMFVNLAIRALRWKYLLEPLAPTDSTQFLTQTAQFTPVDLPPELIDDANGLRGVDTGRRRPPYMLQPKPDLGTSPGFCRDGGH